MSSRKHTVSRFGKQDGLFSLFSPLSLILNTKPDSTAGEDSKGGKKQLSRHALTGPSRLQRIHSSTNACGHCAPWEEAITPRSFLHPRVQPMSFWEVLWVDGVVLTILQLSQAARPRLLLHTLGIWALPDVNVRREGFKNIGVSGTGRCTSMDVCLGRVCTRLQSWKQ